MGIRTALLATILLVGLQACGAGEKGDAETRSEPAGASAEPIRVLTVNYPLAFFAQRIGGSEVDARFPGPPGEDPAYWKPTPEQIAEYQAADLVLLNGAGYAGWTDRAALPPSRLVNTSESVSERYVREEETLIHAHGPEGEHEHGTQAFTTWLDPTIALEQARSIRDALAAERPEKSSEFDSGFSGLEQDLIALDSTLARIARQLDGRPMLASHPVYQYLAARYGIDLRSVHFEPDEVPDADAWAELERLQKERQATVMLWEDQPLPEVTGRLAAEHGIRSVVFSPCANTPDVDDYVGIMRENAQRLSSLAD
jgi:zinc transport system substrate-binding protein